MALSATVFTSYFDEVPVSICIDTVLLKTPFSIKIDKFVLLIYFMPPTSFISPENRKFLFSSLFSEGRDKWHETGERSSRFGNTLTLSCITRMIFNKCTFQTQDFTLSRTIFFRMFTVCYFNNQNSELFTNC